MNDHFTECRNSEENKSDCGAIREWVVAGAGGANFSISVEFERDAYWRRFDQRERNWQMDDS